MTKELKAIKKWLSKDGNSEALLAAMLGYKSSTAISMWFKRGQVPFHIKTRLQEVLK